MEALAETRQASGHKHDDIRVYRELTMVLLQLPDLHRVGDLMDRPATAAWKDAALAAVMIDLALELLSCSREGEVPGWAERDRDERRPRARSGFPPPALGPAPVGPQRFRPVTAFPICREIFMSAKARDEDCNPWRHEATPVTRGECGSRPWGGIRPTSGESRGIRRLRFQTPLRFSLAVAAIADLTLHPRPAVSQDEPVIRLSLDIPLEVNDASNLKKSAASFA
jgi:hypothetical protein